MSHLSEISRIQQAFFRQILLTAQIIRMITVKKDRMNKVINSLLTFQCFTVAEVDNKS